MTVARTACMRVPAVIVVVYRRDGDAAGMARSIITFLPKEIPERALSQP